MLALPPDVLFPPEMVVPEVINPVPEEIRTPLTPVLKQELYGVPGTDPAMWENMGSFHLPSSTGQLRVGDYDPETGLV